MKKTLKNHFKNDLSVQTLPDLRNSYFLECTAQVTIEYTYNQLCICICGCQDSVQYSDLLLAEWSRDHFQAAARVSMPVPTGPEAHPASCTVDTRSLPAVKQLTPTPHSSTEFVNEFL